MRFREVAEIPIAPGARVYEHGWQSWSPAGAYPAQGISARPRGPLNQIMGYRPGKPLPEQGFQGEGLLAVDPGDGGPVRVYAAADPATDVPSIRACAVDGRVLVSADGEVAETSCSGSLGTALAEWADLAARSLGVGELREVPPVWCSWYHYFFSVSEEDVLENLAVMDRLGLEVGVVQLDDGYQAAVGDWLLRSPRFRRPLHELADRIRDSGRRAGIWVAPFLVAANSRLARHRDWLVGGAEAGENWGQCLFALDVTHPGASAWLQEVFGTLVSWGFDYFKLDFLYAGALEGRRRSGCSGLEAYRLGLRLIREAVGPDPILLGCGAPLLPSIGLVDAMRVSPDVSLNLEPHDGDLSKPSLRAASLAGRARSFQHGRLWVNDPDCLIVRPAVEMREVWAEHVERFGGLRASGDRLLDLDTWGLETTRRLLQPSSTSPFPQDGLD